MNQKIRNIRPRLSVVLLLIVAACAGVGVVAKTSAARLLARSNVARPEINVALHGSLKRENETISLEKAEAVLPGEVLTWTIDSENTGDGAAQNYATIGQIPTGTSFVADSATSAASTRVTYSIDNGKTYQAQPMIEERLADGSTKRIAAPVSAYTQVRYEWTDALAAGSKFTAEYKVRVR